jgi:hypothetical protein
MIIRAAGPPLPPILLTGFHRSIPIEYRDGVYPLHAPCMLLSRLVGLQRRPAHAQADIHFSLPFSSCFRV